MAGAAGLEATRNVISWLCWIAMACMSGYLFYETCARFVIDLANRLVVSFYITIFGIVGVLFEAGQKHISEGVPFLATRGGKGATFFFVGTLTMSMAFPLNINNPPSIVAFVLSLYALFAAIFNWIVLCCRKEYADVDRQQSGESKPLASGDGPNRI
jgi:hypothetical protein